MSNLSDMVTRAINSEPVTFESLKAAIEPLDKPVIRDKDHPFCGVYKVQECAALKGSEIVVVSGDNVYYWPDIFNQKNVKVIKGPEVPLPTIDLMTFGRTRCQ